MVFTNPLFFHTQQWFKASSRDFRRFECDFVWFPRFLWCFHKKKDIVEELKSIMGARVERSSLSWVCISQKSLAIARDFWNTNSLGWAPFRKGTHDGFSMNITRGYSVVGEGFWRLIEMLMWFTSIPLLTDYSSHIDAFLWSHGSSLSAKAAWLYIMQCWLPFWLLGWPGAQSSNVTASPEVAHRHSPSTARSFPASQNQGLVKS